jgi:hypothetical protein
MGAKSTLALAVILAAIVGYIYFIDSKTPVGDTEAKAKAFTGITADDIEELQIKADNGETSRLQKVDGKWQLVEPVKADADNTEVSNIASSLATIDIQRVVDENASNMKEYGLDPARVEVAFRAKGRQELQRFQLGEKTPAGADIYARLPGQNRVFLVNSFLDSTCNKNTLALRDKRALAIERDKVDSLSLVKTGQTLQFTKRGSEWRIVSPVAARADFGTVESSLERVASLQMLTIVGENAGDLQKYGLDKPSATITVGLGSSKATLLLGKTEDAVVYARDISRPLVFTVAPTLTTDLFKDVNEYRRKDLFDSRSFTTQRITFARPSESISLEKSKDKDGKEIWKNGGGKAIDAAKADDLLAKIGSLQAAMFKATADPALKTPVLTVTAAFDGKMETVAFARSGDTVVASRSDEPGSATVETMAFEDLLKAIEGVK